MPPTSNIKEALGAVNIRYPGKREPASLSDLVTEKHLTDLLKHQYESVHQPGTVQFIPEVRGRFPFRDLGGSGKKRLLVLHTNIENIYVQ